MPGFRENYSIVIAVLVEMLVVVLLLSTPGMMMAEGVQVIDASKDISAGTGIFVRTKLDFGDQKQLDAFPREIGKWRNTYDYPGTEGFADLLDAKTMIFRPYTPDGYVSVNFLAMLSENVSSFHPAEICYRVQGWEIKEDVADSILVKNLTWVEEPLFPVEMNVSLPVRKLVIFNEEQNRSQIVIYLYMKDLRFSVERSMIFLRYSTYFGTMGIVNESEALGILKGFAAETVPYIFMLKKPEQPIGVLMIQKWGFGGAMLEATMIMVPIGFVAYAPLTHWLRKRIGR